MDLKDPQSSELGRLFRSFRFAWAGIVNTFKTERNFKIHVFFSIVVCITGILLQFTKLEWILTLFLIGGVLALELINTAIEQIVNLVSPKYHPLAKAAKDAAAGAVFIYAILSVIVGALIIISHL